MKTINIKGKEYVPVVERVKEFHKQYPDGYITTEVIDTNGDRVSVKATAYIGDKLFTGHSQAVYGVGMMGDVALEIAETSSVGRCLGFLGIGIDTGIASADEMRKVKKLQTNDSDDTDLPF